MIKGRSATRRCREKGTPESCKSYKIVAAALAQMDYAFHVRKS